MFSLNTARYVVGDTIRYTPFGGGVREVVVTEKEDDIKNGRPGFAGHLASDPEFGVWGYDDQII